MTGTVCGRESRQPAVWAKSARLTRRLAKCAFAADKVDISILGDWEDAQIALGLLDKRLTPPPEYVWLPESKIAEYERATTERRAQSKQQNQAKAKSKAKRKQAKKSRQKQRKKK
jgi:hypothetical protein